MAQYPYGVRSAAGFSEYCIFKLFLLLTKFCHFFYFDLCSECHTIHHTEIGHCQDYAMAEKFV